MSLAAGTRIGPYEIRALLGEGGMGQVWRAHDTRLERDVALKLLPAEALADETAHARLIREARLASKLNHPHICTVYEVGEAVPHRPFVPSVSPFDGAQGDPERVEGSKDERGVEPADSGQAVAYIAMELVEGQPLSARLGEGALPAEQVLRYGQQMAEALAHAHARRVVHRDFKSANVVITPDGRVKVLDFGLARRLTDEQLADATTVSRHSLTALGVVAGTLAYMAPEQLKGQPADERSDIWALGVVLYELAAGGRPFQGQTGFELTSAILKEPPPPLPAAVSPALQAVISRCLAKEPGARYQGGNDVQAALEAVQAGTAVVPWTGWKAVLARRAILGTAMAAASVLVLAAILVGLDIGGVRTRLVRGTAGPARAIKLAVLPFANASGDAEQEYFAEGLTGEMIAELGRLNPGALGVIARTSVMQFKKTDKPANQIGRELGVDYLLEGSAQREAGRVRITAALIKVADQTQLWADRFEREMAGILILESEVAQRVANALALTLPPAEQARLAAAKPVDPEVYDLCLRGLSYADRLTAPDLDTAEHYFQRALAKDPNSALAYAGMSSVWRKREQMSIVSPLEARPKAKAAALKAVELDDSLALGHRQLASVLGYEEWDWTGYEREIRRALELAPNDASIRNGYSHVLMFLKRPVEAMQQIERAIELDPLSAVNVSFYAMDLLCARRYEEAIAQARKALGMQPDHPVALGVLYGALFALRKYDDMAALDRRMASGDPELQHAFEQGFAESGYPGSQERWADMWAARYPKVPGIGPIDIANVYMFAGDFNRALDWLERAYADRDPNLPYISCDPVCDPLRQNPRFRAIMRGMNLPQ